MNISEDNKENQFSDSSEVSLRDSTMFVSSDNELEFFLFHHRPQIQIKCSIFNMIR